MRAARVDHSTPAAERRNAPSLAAFTCGNGKSYVVEQHGYLIVQRRDWLGRRFIDYAHSLAEATARIAADAHCWQIRAA